MKMISQNIRRISVFFHFCILALLANGCIVQNSSDSNQSGKIVDLTVAMAPPEFGFQMTMPAWIVPPGEEILMCALIRLDMPEEMKGQVYWIDEAETLTSSGSHHMNINFGEFSFYDAYIGEGAAYDFIGIEPGLHDCDDLPDDVMEKALPIFPTQNTNQKVQLPKGGALPVVDGLVLLFNHHFVNTTEKPVKVNTVFNLHAVPREQVERPVALLLQNDNGQLNVDPFSQKVYSRTCIVSTEREIQVNLVSSHNHEWGSCATMNKYDGQTGQIDPDPFYVNKWWETPPLHHFQSGVFTLKPGDGIHWACHYQNTTDRTLVNDGSADGEMCVMAAVLGEAPVSVEEIEEALATNDLVKILEMAEKAFVECEEIMEMESPWPMTTESHPEPFVDTCEGYEQTESNTLRE